MATIAFRTFVDVYDDSDNYYSVYIPEIVWNTLVANFPDATEDLVESDKVAKNKPKTGIVEISGWGGDIYGQDWWNEIEDDLLVCYANGRDMQIVHKDCEDVANHYR